MKKIEAIIRPECLELVRNGLGELGYPGMTVYDIKGHGKQGQLTEQWRGREYKVDLLPKLKVELVVLDEDVTRIVSAIVRNARTGEMGDGKIFILPVDGAVRVRTGDNNENAI